MSDSPNPSQPPTRANKDLELLREAGRHLDKFLCQGDQRTDLEDSAVPIISMLDDWADNPFPISKEIATERSIPFNVEKHRFVFLKDFLSNFKKFRISRMRKGREEDKQVMMSYMNAIMDAMRDHEKNSVPGHLR